MSLMNAAGCCCCIGTCACMPSSITITIPAWSTTSNMVFLSMPATTVIAYKCCFSYDGIARFTYRFTSIYMGSYTDAGCTPALAIPVYFNFYIAHNVYYSSYPNCELEFNAGLFRSYYSSPCVFCVDTPLVINATTVCDKCGTNEVCGRTNTYMEEFLNSFFANDSCTCATAVYSEGSDGGNLQFFPFNCSLPSSIGFSFNGDPLTFFTIT